MQVEPKTGREVDRRALGIAFRTSIEPSIDLATRRGEMWLSFTSSSKRRKSAVKLERLDMANYSSTLLTGFQRVMFFYAPDISENTLTAAASAAEMLLLQQTMKWKGSFSAVILMFAHGSYFKRLNKIVPQHHRRLHLVLFSLGFK